MDPVTALKLEAKILPALAQTLVPILATFLRTDEPESVFLSRGIREVFESLPPEVIAETMISILSDPNLSVDGERVEFAKDFSGGKNVALRYKVFYFVMEANYADFLESLVPVDGTVRAKGKALFEAKVVEMLKATGPSPEASTGASGGPA